MSGHIERLHDLADALAAHALLDTDLQVMAHDAALHAVDLRALLAGQSKSVTWVLESNVFAETCFDRMMEHFRQRGVEHHVVRIIPFVHEIEGRVPDVNGPCVVYGSIGIQKLADRHGWSPGVFPVPTEDEAAIALGDLYLNSDAMMMKMSEVEAYLAKTITGEEVFIKPDTDTKEFAGQVIDAAQFSSWYAGMIDSGYLDGNDFYVVVSSPKKLGCEWRVVVVDGKIVTSSLYRQWGMVKAEEHILPEVVEVVMAAHAKLVPGPVYVIDIAQHGDEFKVIEYNTFNSAGLYECNVEAIIDAVSEYVGR
jgi:hypothetical protein